MTRPSFEKLYLLFLYIEGRLIWLSDRSNGRIKAGTEAGWLSHNGYLNVKIGHQSFLVHHIVWALHHQEWPTNIDHIDRNPLNNRIENMRQVSHTVNMNNKGRYLNNTSGQQGVSWSKAHNKWVSRITINKKTTEKMFLSLDQAIAYRKEMEKMRDEFIAKQSTNI